MLLCVCWLSGCLIAIPILKPCHEYKDEGPTGKGAAHLIMELWVDRFGTLREICSDRVPQFLRLVPAQLRVSRVDTRVMAKRKIRASS